MPVRSNAVAMKAKKAAHNMAGQQGTPQQFVLSTARDLLRTTKVGHDRDCFMGWVRSASLVFVPAQL